MSYTERDLQSALTKYLRIVKPLPISFVYELKLARGTRFAWREVAEHQWTNLHNAKHGCVAHKISDLSLGQKPFDGFSVCRVSAYLGVCFYIPRKIKKLYLLDADTASAHAMENKSIREEEAQTLAEFRFVL